MRARLFPGAAIIVVAVCGVSGQTGTADGVAALARGDYQRAVEILKPIAEDWRTNDPAAQFFMAGLYETGRGVPADPLRACALYLRAAAKYENPFGREATRLIAASSARGPEFSEECHSLANIGFDNGFEPATFDLGPGHSVAWSLAAATVTYDGRTKRVPMPFELPGARFLPLQYTELATGRTRALTRHFIEVFVWQPSGRSGPWTLQWHVYEVVRDEPIRIDVSDEPLATVAGDAPPSQESFDVREYAVLRVDDEGNAEWAVLKEPRPRTQRIESDAERREVREGARARDAALKRVDWTRRYAFREERLVERNNLGHVRNGILGEARCTRLQQHIAWSVRPFEIARQRYADNDRDAAPVQCIPLHDYDRPAKTRFGSDGWRNIGPPYLALRNHHSMFSRTRRPAAATNGTC